jgi:ATP-dependent Clp protease, protease subunit
MIDFTLKKRKGKGEVKEEGEVKEDGGTIIPVSSIDFSNNVIYFNGDVNDENNLKLNKQIKELGIELKGMSLKYGISVPPIELQISSYGGSLFSCFSSIEHIVNSVSPVHTYISGYAASAATLMSVCGKERYIGEHSYMLIHQLSSMHWGKYSDLKDDMKNCKSLMKKIRDIYSERTKIPKKELKKILKHDLWWDAKKCLKYGLVDDII